MAEQNKSFKVETLQQQQLQQQQQRLQPQFQPFGPHKLNQSQIFYQTDLIFAAVNISPLVPGHVLVCPKRVVPKYKDLTKDEILDIFSSAQTISTKLEEYYKTSALNFGLQDGRDAGQSVPHVHLHILPRKKGDFKKNDEIYEKLNADVDEQEAEVRVRRSEKEMAEEADIFRKLFL